MEIECAKKQISNIKDAPPSIKEAKIESKAPSRSIADSANSLEELQNLVENFEGCSLKKLAKNTVFGDGKPSAKVMLVGEAPGATEDERGIPFCGESGKLLDNMFASIGLSREKNLYITNSIFWRPPANRNPSIEEIEACRPFLEKHISLINPELIIMVGGIAATSMLGEHGGVGKLRRNYYDYSNKYLPNPIKITAIYHPAYLLRSPQQKKLAWYDLLEIDNFLKS